MKSSPSGSSIYGVQIAVRRQSLTMALYPGSLSSFEPVL